MLNYLRAEFYKVFHRKYIYVFTGVLVLLALFINVVMATSGSDQLMSVLFTSLIFLLMPVLYLFLFFADITGNEEYKVQTYKNAVSFGLSREKIYWSKLIVTTVISVLCLAVVLVVFIGAGILLSGGSGLAGETAQLFFVRLGVSVPLYLGCIGIAVMLAMVFRSTVAFVSVYIAFMGVTGNVFQLLGLKYDIFNTLKGYLIPTQFDYMTMDPYGRPEMLRAVVVGLAFFAVATVAGLLIFRKKEIK